MTPDFTDTITLGDDVFSDEYWANHRVAPLLDAMRGVMADPPDYGKYIAYWHTRCKGDDAEAKRIGECYRALAAKIKTDGYTSNAWQHDGRDFDVTQGHGPMSVDIGNDGKLWPIDGSHRACILWLLGEPVTMWVWRRRPKWEKLKTFHKTLYTPYPHPDFAGHPVTRQSRDRFIHGITNLSPERADKFNVCIVGACTGLSSRMTANAIGMGATSSGTIVAIEPQPERLALLRSIATRVELYPTLHCIPPAKIIPCGDYAHKHDYATYDAILGYSVYQHVATNLERWQLVCGLLGKCPLHILELPGNHEHQWHDKFREETNGKPQEAIIAMLIQAGGYEPPRVIYTDTTYANRQTILLQRP